MTALPQVQNPEANVPMSDEELMRKDLERQKRAQASLERLGLAGQITTKASKYAPLGTPNLKDVSDTSVKNQPVRVTGDSTQLERTQVTLLGKIWSVLNRVSTTMDKQLEYDEEQTLQAREDRLESSKRVDADPIVSNDNDDSGGMAGMVKTLALALAPILAPVATAAAGIGGAYLAIKAIADKLGIPTGAPGDQPVDPNTGIEKPSILNPFPEWNKGGGLVGFIGRKTGAYQWSKDKSDEAPQQAEGESSTGEKKAVVRPNGDIEVDINASGARQIRQALDARVKADLIRHEGKRDRVYKDSKGLPTIGIGHLIKKGERFSGRISEDQINKLFEKDYADNKAGVSKMKNFDKLNDAGKAALINMAFNMGPAFWQKWKTMQRAMKEMDAEKLKFSIMKSKYWTSDLPQNKQRYRDMKEYVRQIDFSGATFGDKAEAIVEKDKGVGTQPTSTQSETGKTISGLVFGGEFNARKTWARPRDLRNLQTPGLIPTMIRPEMPKTDSGLTSLLSRIVGGHKGQKPPVGIDSTGNVPSPSADQVGINYRLYFHTEHSS